MRNHNRVWAAAGLAAVALFAAACGSSSSSTGPGTSGSTTPATSPASTPAGAAAQTLGTAKIGGATVLTNSKGLTLYWFAKDTATTSNCTGACATFWPPVTGTVTAGAGVNSSKIGSITRSDGTKQATYDGHPLYTYSGDTAPGQNNGNNINASGGVWHEVTLSAGAPAPAPSSSSTGGGYGY